MAALPMKEGYIPLYSTLNIAEAHIIAFLLENHGIEAVIENEGMNPLFGMVSAKDAEARVLVRRDRFIEAAAMLKESSSVDISRVNLTRCRRCGEMVCDMFEYCWNCMSSMKTGAPLPGGASKPAAARPARLPVILYLFLVASLLAVIAYYLFLFFRSGR
jgi:hypothetical protein